MPAIPKGKKGTLLFVGLHVAAELEDSNAAKKVFYGGDALALLFEPNTVVENFTVPANLDIVVLLDDGVDWLLTQKNANMLRTNAVSSQWMQICNDDESLS